ncbi:MAG: hypothetical protein QOE75_1677 [Solirubrobacterales bacterium]|nr:hypothetical protein [Solirubrobacterales bacterium]
MTEPREPIRSYQRIFRPERRIYQLEGRALPVPGGVPLRWLGYATAALLAVLAIGSGSATVAALIAVGAALAGLVVGGRGAALAAGAGAFAGFWIAEAVLGLLDWPLRLVVVPIAVATLATQATPDGRRADRFALSWIALRLAPRRRSLGRGLPAAGTATAPAGSLWVAPDEHSPRLRRGRVTGKSTATFSEPVRVRRAGLRQRRLRARPARGRVRRGELETTRLAVGEGEKLELRP